MKKFFVSFFCSFLLAFYAFADSNLILKSSSENPDIAEAFSVTLILESAESGSFKGVEIPGIENFNTLSSSTSQNIMVINGSAKGSIEYILGLEPIKSGEFTIGPVKMPIGSGEVVSNTLTIRVPSGNKKSQLSEKEKNENSASVQEDIFYEDLSPSSSFINIYKVFFILFLLLFFGLAFYFFKYFFSQFSEIKKENKKNEQPVPTQKMEDYFLEELTRLENNLQSYDKLEFLEKFNSLERLYIEKKYAISDAMNLTAEEMKKKMNILSEQEMFHLFEKSYFYLYDENREMTTLDFQWLISDFRNVINKK